MKKRLYLCTQMQCKHFWDEFEIEAGQPTQPDTKCPACGSQAEWTGHEERLAERILAS